MYKSRNQQKPCATFKMPNELGLDLSALSEEINDYSQNFPGNFDNHIFCARALVSWINTSGVYSSATNALANEKHVSNLLLEKKLQTVCASLAGMFSDLEFDDSPILQIMLPGALIMTHSDSIDVDGTALIPYNLTIAGGGTTTFYEQDRTTIVQKVSNAPGEITRFDQPDAPHNVRAGSEGRISIAMMQIA